MAQYISNICLLSNNMAHAKYSAVNTLFECRIPRGNIRLNILNNTVRDLTIY